MAFGGAVAQKVGFWARPPGPALPGVGVRTAPSLLAALRGLRAGPSVSRWETAFGAHGSRSRGRPHRVAGAQPLVLRGRIPGEATGPVVLEDQARLQPQHRRVAGQIQGQGVEVLGVPDRHLEQQIVRGRGATLDRA